MSELIRVEHLAKTYFLGEVQVPALKGVDLTIQAGELLAIMGASGSGKSTFMNIIGCRDRSTQGSYFLEGKDVSGLTWRHPYLPESSRPESDGPGSR